MVSDLYRNFVNKEIMPVRHLIDDDKDHKRIKKILQAMTAIGHQKAAFPVEYGGAGMTSALSAAVMHEELGRGDSDKMLSRASIAKVYAADVVVMVANKAMELMGSYGYVREYHVEKYWRDCKIIQQWEGGGQLGRFDVCRGYYDCKL